MKMAALIVLSNSQSDLFDCNAVSPPTKIEIGHVIPRRIAVRRCRHRRRPPKAGYDGPANLCRPAPDPGV